MTQGQWDGTMTEGEWNRSDDLHRLLQFLEGRASDRKLRLFSLACCRRVWPHLDQFDREVVEAAERTVDGAATPADAGLLRRSADDFHKSRTFQKRFLACLFHGRRSRTPVQISWFLAHLVGAADTMNGPEARAERVAQVALLRDVAGNPFRPAGLDLAWVTPTAVAVARAMYDSRDFDGMPILADALEDADCQDEQLLGHCHGPALHARGCWLIDLILGKE